MNRNLCLVVAITLCGCTSPMRKEQPWSFVTATGGLELGSPVSVDGRWELPIRANVSGLETITLAPTTMNSGLVCDETRTRVEGRDIFLLIVTTLPHGEASARCPAAKLGALESGRYDILYGSHRAESVRLGTIDLPPQATQPVAR